VKLLAVAPLMSAQWRVVHRRDVDRQRVRRRVEINTIGCTTVVLHLEGEAGR
jgi:hypothetical protein